MFPESLVTLNTYGDHKLASRDLRRLTRAGIHAYLGGQYFRFHRPVELKVPESDVERALKILDLAEGDEPAPEPPEIRIPCPECGAPAKPFPPYARYLFVAGVSVFLVSLVLGHEGIGFIAIAVGWIGATLMSAKAGRYRCHACRYQWQPM
ncbi:MAG TPA: hypothetical protein VIE39_02420 [Thermoanaerobaculia bacterium]